MSFWQWSKTASVNASVDPAINWAEGQAPSSVNDSARAMMAGLASYRDDISGFIPTGGTSTAYTLTTNQGFPATPTTGQLLAFAPHTTNGATPTLACDGGTAFQIQSASGVPIPSGVLIASTPYTVMFGGSAWLLRDFYGNPTQVPIGALLPYTGATAPNSNFILPFGQAISRTVYATYFALVGTTWGVGDGSTTFNVPDLRGRNLFGVDNMGGSTAGRVTSAGSGIDGTVLGTTGGAQNVTLVQANLPSVNFTVSGITLNDPVHAHTTPASNSGVAGATNNVLLANGNTGTISTSSNISGVTVATQGTAASGGSGTAVNKMPPAMMMTFILRVL